MKYWESGRVQVPAGYYQRVVCITHHTTLDQGISYFDILKWLLTRKDDGLIVALSDNLERPIVGQSGTFVEPGSANLISFQVEESSG